MAKNYFNRYVWLIDTIRRAGHITMQEISDEWERSALNETGMPLAERTFFNHRDAISDTFGIEIKNDRSLGYYIANTGDIEGDSLREWMFDSLALNNLLNESAGLSGRILFEKVPSSMGWLKDIIQAMKEGYALEMTYQSFWRDSSNTFETHPYCLKLFKQRWYLLAKSESKDEPRIYALDRIHNLKKLNVPLKLPKNFNAEEFFSDYFGIIIGSDNKPMKIDLKVDNQQAKYYESLPLHHSQRIVEQTEEYTVYRYNIAPTYDFVQEILSKGDLVEVTAPQSFRKRIAEVAKNMMSYYEDVFEEEGDNE